LSKVATYYLRVNNKMQIIIGFLVFCLVLFVYVHIYYHIRISNDLEVFEIDDPSKDKLEEVCDMRQPVRFNFIRENITNLCSQKSICNSYGAFDVKIRDLQLPPNAEEEIYIPLPLVNALTVLNDDKESRYVVESNNDFLEETGLVKEYQIADEFIRPYMVVSCDYDLCMGSEGACTPFQYDLNYRNYYLVTEGEVTIKLSPPRSSKHLHEIRDYENYEFKSPINPWNVESKYKNDFDKIKCLEITLTEGEILYIPAYWWYTIKYNSNSTICMFKYKTYMNTLAILPKIFMRFLQLHNVKRNTASIIDIDKGNSGSAGIAATTNISSLQK